MANKHSKESWFKLQGRLLESSVWEEDPATRIVWITLLALAQKVESRNDGPGVVLITPGNLIRKAFVSKAEFEHAIERLTAPDPLSRTNAPRLEVLPNGYRIPAFEQYNDTEIWERWRERASKGGKARAENAVRDETGKFQSKEAE
jgi:hypothetical protein